MKIIQELPNEFYPHQKNVEILFDDDIREWPYYQSITNNASGGFTFEANTEDEFGNTRTLKIILEKIDIENIKELLEKNLIY